MKRFVAVVTCAAAVAGVGSAASAPGFTPKSLAGRWSGAWMNQTFGSTGPTVVTIKSLARNTKLQFTVDFGGNVFGCTDPAAESSKQLTKGSGFGHWSAAGFKIKGPSEAFGTLTIAYADRTKNLVGSGANPTCANGLTWKLAGRFTGRVFAGTIDIKLANGSTAVSTLALTSS